MLYVKGQNGFEPWDRGPIDGVSHPANIEQLWSDEELNAAGLYKANDPGIPDGKVATSSSVQLVNGVPTVVYVLEDAPPAPLPVLLPYQFFAMLEISGKKPALDAFIASIPAPGNIVAKAKLDRSLEFRRDNDLVLAAQQALGLTNQQLDVLWMQAAAL